MRFCLKRVHFDAFRPSAHTYTPSIFIKKRIDLKTLLKVDQNENAHVSYSSGQSNKKNMMTENITGACVLQHARRVQLTSQRAILSFSNVLVWTVDNVSKR